MDILNKVILKDIESIIVEEGSKSENVILTVLAVAGGILIIYGIVIIITLLNAAS